MEDMKMTEQESLQIIQQMIDQTRKSVVRGKVFLWIGYSLCLLSVASMVILSTFFNNPIAFNAIWWLLFIYLVAIGICFRTGKLSFGSKDGARTYIEKTLLAIWQSAYAMILLLLLTMGMDLCVQDYATLHYYVLIIDCCLIMAGLATTIIMKEQHINYSAVASGIIFSQLTHFADFANRTPWRNLGSELLILIFIAVVIFIIPGHKLNRLSKKEEVQNRCKTES